MLPSVEIGREGATRFYAPKAYFFVTGMKTHYCRAEDSVAVPLPNMSYCDYPVFLWPKDFGLGGENCNCVPTNFFGTCAELCGTEYTVTLNESNSIIFSNLNATTEDFSVHFICAETPCTGSSCVTESMVLSYRIEVESKYMSIMLLQIAVPFET